MGPQDPENGFVRMDYTWYGTPPQLKGERIAWVKECYQKWSDLNGQEACFLAVFHDDSNEMWRFAPHRKPIRLFRNMDGYVLPKNVSLAKHTCIP
jgi:hypothetical protein